MKAEVINPNSSEVLIERGAQAIFNRFGLDWNSGLGQVAREVIRENAPRVDVSPVTIAREFGILRKKGKS